MTKTIDWYARTYVERFGFQLVPIEAGRKYPKTNDWGNNTLNDPDEAERFYIKHPKWNMGVSLGGSRMCSLDIDCMRSFKLVLDEFGVPMEELDDYPTIQGSAKGTRIEFRVPDGVELPYCKLTWPSRNDPTGEKHRNAMRLANDAKHAGDEVRESRIRAIAKRWSRYTVFELRAASNGSQKQDVLPPSIHPGTGKPYRWIVQPPSAGMPWPSPPDWLLAVWSAWDAFKPQFQDSCPWAEKQTYPKASERKQLHKPSGGVGIIQRYNEANDLAEHLSRYGYERKSKRRWVSPHTTTKLAGVVMFPDERRCWIHHASDPLCSDEKGCPVSPFDLVCEYDYNGDAKAACKALASEYGAPAVTYTPPIDTTQTDEPAEAGTTVSVVGRSAATAGTNHMVDTITPLPLTTGDSGKPLKHIDNLRELCRRLGVVIRYNEMSKEEEIIIPAMGFTQDNESNATLAWLKSECSRFKFPPDCVQEFATVLADANVFHPVRAWIGSKPWDGVDRLQDFYNTIQTHGDEWLKNRLIYRWCMSAIAAAFAPNGVSAHGVLVLQGEQGLGKTSWLEALAPKHMKLIKDGVTLKPDDKDSIKQATSHWIVELGELDGTFRRSDIAQLKSFITKASDTYRKPYARRESTFARRTVFFGSVNPREFLHDPTGNRRYWTIECSAVNYLHEIDMQQLWAQLYTIWQTGEKHWLSPDESAALNATNEEHVSADPIEERVLSGYDWERLEHSDRWLTTTSILQELGIDRPTRSETTAAGTLIRKINGNRSRRGSGGARLVKVPPRCLSSSGF